MSITLCSFHRHCTYIMCSVRHTIHDRGRQLLAAGAAAIQCGLAVRADAAGSSVAAASAGGSKAGIVAGLLGTASDLPRCLAALSAAPSQGAPPLSAALNKGAWAAAATLLDAGECPFLGRPNSPRSAAYRLPSFQLEGRDLFQDFSPDHMPDTRPDQGYRAKGTTRVSNKGI